MFDLLMLHMQDMLIGKVIQEHLTLTAKDKLYFFSEADLVAVDDCIGSVLRVRHFLLAQSCFRED